MSVNVTIQHSYEKNVVHNAAVTCEIKLFQNNVGGLLQLMNIFQHLQCR